MKLMTERKNAVRTLSPSRSTLDAEEMDKSEIRSALKELKYYREKENQRLEQLEKIAPYNKRVPFDIYQSSPPKR